MARTEEEILAEIEQIEKEHTAPTQYQLFRGQDLSGRDFSGQDLTGCNFREVNLTGANFEDAILHYANFKDAILDGVKTNSGTKVYCTAWFVHGLKNKNAAFDNEEPEWMKTLDADREELYEIEEQKRRMENQDG